MPLANTSLSEHNANHKRGKQEFSIRPRFDTFHGMLNSRELGPDGTVMPPRGRRCCKPDPIKFPCGGTPSVEGASASSPVERLNRSFLDAVQRLN